LVPVKYILVAAQKAKVVELQNKLDGFRERLVVDIAIEIRLKQGLIFMLGMLFSSSNSLY